MEHNCIQAGEIRGMQEQIKTLFETMKKQDGLIETMHELTLTIRDLANSTETMKKDIAEVKTCVAELKSQPGNRWNTVVDTALKVAVGALVGYLFIRAGMGA